MWEDRISEIQSLHPALVRLFIQEYFNVYPKKSVYQWKTLDRSVETILGTGATPLMCIAIKPKALFPQINQDIVEPGNYAEWEELIYQMVKHYEGKNITYWEVSNEPDIGESGGCPSRFTPENYPRFYEHTVKAIRRANPRAKVGGPALANVRSPLFKALLEHCSKRSIPLDFVSWHIYSSDPKIRQTIDYAKSLLAGYSSASEKFLNEWNMSPNPVQDPRFQPALSPRWLIKCSRQS
jgi:beta-xylosidase